jgi:transposase
MRNSKRKFSKTSRRKVNRIPYNLFRHTLKHVAKNEGVFMEVKASYTSQTHLICGFVSEKNWLRQSKPP